MGQPRKHPPPRFMTVVASAPEEAERRREELLKLAEPRRGRPVRVDRLREAMAAADQYPPTPKRNWRRTRGKSKTDIEPRREALAAGKLEEIVAGLSPTAPPLKRHNSTRAIEQAREIIDNARGISPKARHAIEEGREAIQDNQSIAALGGAISRRDRTIIARAIKEIERAHSVDPRDEEILSCGRTLLEIRHCRDHHREEATAEEPQRLPPPTPPLPAAGPSPLPRAAAVVGHAIKSSH
jgi:hypothetical protein